MLMLPGSYRARPEDVRLALEAQRAERADVEYHVARLELDAQVARRRLAEYDRAKASARMPW